jgi:DNA-binding transcriptional ArsR family regulator
MSFRPGLANLASVIADTGREAILVALADGRALPAGELAEIAGISPQSASRHLQKMVEGRLLEVWAQGRFRYYRIASEEIAALLEAMSAIASHNETTLGCARSSRLPRSLCEARRCYNHLAGRLGVDLVQAFVRRRYVSPSPNGRDMRITASGQQWLMQIGVAPLDQAAFRLCMDGTERRPHFAGPVATALLGYLEAQKFVIPDQSERRALRITVAGKLWLADLGIDLDGYIPDRLDQRRLAVDR